MIAGFLLLLQPGQLKASFVFSGSAAMDAC
jgi:hypothetical protein